MPESNERISDIELGERLRVARERAKLTQSDAAEVIGAVRTTVVAIEKGQRRIRIDELQNLAKAYGTSANALLRQESVVLDLVPRFRKLASSTDDTIETASRMLNDLLQAEVELENMLAVRRPLDYPPERPVLPGDIRLQAEQDSQQLRDRLGLGPEPIADIMFDRCQAGFAGCSHSMNPQAHAFFLTRPIRLSGSEILLRMS
jgi:transcriptional regulator with XRE-family HTH domain